jgi:hypothetical protein
VKGFFGRVAWGLAFSKRIPIFGCFSIFTVHLKLTLKLIYVQEIQTHQVQCIPLARQAGYKSRKRWRLIHGSSIDVYLVRVAVMRGAKSPLFRPNPQESVLTNKFPVRYRRRFTVHTR